MSGVRQHNLSWKEQLQDVKAGLSSEDTFFGGYVSNRHRRRSKHPKERNPFEGVTFGKESSINAGPSIGNESCNLGPDVVEIQGIHFKSDRSEVARSSEANAGAFMSNSRDQSSNGEEDYEARTKLKTSNKGGDDEFKQDLGSYIASLEEELQRRIRNEIQQDRNRKVEKAAVWGSLIAGTLTVVAGASVLIVGMLGGHKSNIMNL